MKTILSLIFFLFVLESNCQDSLQHSVQDKVKTETLLEQLLAKEDLKNDMVRIETVTFPPNYSSRSHTHPCPLFVYVLEGELISEFEGVRKKYRVGDVFYERKDGLHSITYNPSTTTSAKILVLYIMKQGMNTFRPTN